MNKLKLGTRRSLLAWAQSSWVAREVERLNPGNSVELVGIDTRGDKILDVSLRNVTGKEFFVAELDDALHSGAVDFTVHSMKDLSLERPAPFVLAAIPRRENPRDVILFGPSVLPRLRAGAALRIGTSSPRRLENIPGFLQEALPRFGVLGVPRVELVEIRGNVNTRLGRVHEPTSSERALDGVVLAFAGLIRLWADNKGRAELVKLLQHVRWMVLPLRENPAAPAQGALAVECRADDARVRGMLAKLHDPETAERVHRERQLLADWGGGCHQRFGATAIRSRELGDVMYVRGRKPDHSFVDELRWDRPASSDVAQPTRDDQIWDGSKLKSEATTEPLATTLSGAAFFVAHPRALAENSSLPENARVWASGVSTWSALARRGVWVEGCAESLGFEFAEPILGEKVLGLPPFGPQWTVLTHAQAASGWRDARVAATYRIDSKKNESAASRLVSARYVFWSSSSQFDLYGGQTYAGVKHSCGPGKTAAHLRERGVEPIVFPTAEEWRKWLKTN